MKVIGRQAGAFALIFLALCAGGCESRKHQAEVVSTNGGKKGLIKVGSSDEAYTAFQRLAERYASPHGVTFEIFQTQSGNILDLLDKGAIDLGVTARKIHQEGKFSGVSYVPFAFDGAIFLVSSDVNVRSLSSAQLRSVLEGRVTNWKEVGGADSKINIIGRPPYSAVTLSLGTGLFDGKFPAMKNPFILETSEGTFQALRSLSSYIAPVPLSRTITDHFAAVPVVVDGMEPLISRVPFEKYPSKLEYGIYFGKDAPETVTEFANFLVSLDGMHQLASLGLAPARQNMSLSACHCRATEGTFVPSKKSELAGNFTIAVVPELGAIQQERRYAGICQVIAEGLGIRTQVRHMESYGRVIDEFAEGKIDAAFVGSLVYGHLHARFGVVPIARPEREGVSHYTGVIIVPAKSPVRQFADLKGRSYAYVPNTSAGELFTLSLVGKGNGLSRYFSRIERVSSHTDVVRLVESGMVEGGAVKNLVLERMYADAPELKGKIRVLKESSSFPENALVVSPMMPESQKKKLMDILLSCEEKESGRVALVAMGAERFVPTSDGEYSNVYALGRSVDYRFGR